MNISIVVSGTYNEHYVTSYFEQLGYTAALRCGNCVEFIDLPEDYNQSTLETLVSGMPQATKTDDQLMQELKDNFESDMLERIKPKLEVWLEAHLLSKYGIEPLP